MRNVVQSGRPLHPDLLPDRVVIWAQRLLCIAWQVLVVGVLKSSIAGAIGWSAKFFGF